MGCSVLRNEFVLVPSQGFLVILCVFPQEHNIESDNVTLCTLNTKTIKKLCSKSSWVHHLSPFLMPCEKILKCISHFPNHVLIFFFLLLSLFFAVLFL